MRSSLHRQKTNSRPIPWLPFDSRLIVPIFSWGHVRGIAKAFLILEMILAVGIVIGTLLIILFKFK